MIFLKNLVDYAAGKNERSQFKEVYAYDRVEHCNVYTQTMLVGQKEQHKLTTEKQHGKKRKIGQHNMPALYTATVDWLFSSPLFKIILELISVH